MLAGGNHQFGKAIEGREGKREQCKLSLRCSNQ